MYLLSFLMSNHHIAGLCGIAPPFTLLDHTSRPLSTIPTPLAHSAPFLHLLPARRRSYTSHGIAHVVAHLAFLPCAAGLLGSSEPPCFSACPPFWLQQESDLGSSS